GHFAEKTRDQTKVVARAQMFRVDSNPISVASIASGLTARMRATPASVLAERFNVYTNLLRLPDMLRQAVEPIVRAALVERILPSPDHSEVADLIEQSARHAQRNPFLVQVIAELGCNGLTDLGPKKTTAWSKDAVDVIAYALVLERLTVACRQDWRVMKAFMRYWRGMRKQLKWRAYAQRFLVLKLLSVEYPLAQLLRYL
ncbi:MAG: hypothetical protein AAFV29_04375, partial [Myxococcota bacterium]